MAAGALVVLAALGCGGQTRPPPDGGADQDAGADASCAAVCVLVDGDGDGYGAQGCGDDCDDSAAVVHPGADDPAGDGLDQDCDGTDGVDKDQDGHLAASSGGDDCDDGSATVHPGGNDGSGLVVEGLPRMPEGYLGARRLAVEPSGVAHLVFAAGESCLGVQNDPEGGRMLRHATNRGGEWTTDVVDTGCVSAGFSIALDAQGSVHVAYALRARPPEDPRQGIVYATNRTGRWVPELLPGEGGDPGQFTAIAVDSCGAAHVLFSPGSREPPRADGDLLHATNGAGHWQTSVVAPGGSGPCSLAEGPGGRLQMVAVLESGFVNYSAQTGEQWPLELVASREPGEHFSVAMALDTLGNPRILVQGERAGLLFATRGEEGAWTTVPIDTDVHQESYWLEGAPSLALDPAGASHVLYMHHLRLDGDIRYATNRTGEWTTTPLTIGNFPEIAIDATGARHVAYLWSYGTISEPRDGIDQNCDGVDGVDADRDGHASSETGGDDPDDADPAVP